MSKENPQRTEVVQELRVRIAYMVGLPEEEQAPDHGKVLDDLGRQYLDARTQPPEGIPERVIQAAQTLTD